MWQYQNNALGGEQLQVNESLFTLANGYLGVRGCFEEGYSDLTNSIRGTYINGLFDTLPVRHPEKLFGFPEFQDKQPNLIDTQTVIIELDGEVVSLFNESHDDFKRTLHLDKGYSERSFTYKLKSGKTARISFKRLVSLNVKELFLQHIEIVFEGRIRITSVMDCDVTNYVNTDDPRVGSEHSRLLNVTQCSISENIMSASFETVHSKIAMSCVTSHKLIGIDKIELQDNGTESMKLSMVYEGEGQVELTKYNVYTDGLRYSYPDAHAKNVLDAVLNLDFSEHLETQEAVVSMFWDFSDIEIRGHEEDQLAIRYNLYQLYQSVGRDKFSNISAKGLSGEGYEGHYFWDTEIYVLPTFQASQNGISRNLLLYRYNQLEAARTRAKELGHTRGVKFPWRTISGIECSAYYPAGTAQYHINGDVAHGFIQNYLYTEDLDFMRDYGAEVLFETALLWLDIGHFQNGLFKIDCVTGPDEYTAIVNNNYYTNALAKHNLDWAVKMYDLLKVEEPESLLILMSKIDLSECDIELMKKASESMYLPHDEKLGIDMQDDSFLNKKVWDFEATPESHYPLLLHYHPLTIYRYQVLKQPDTVLAHFLLEEYSDIETMVKSYDYYESITTHDSSLSACVYGIMASRVGYKDKAYDYFKESLKLDLENTHGNTRDGLHMANLAGTALSMLYGFAGLRISSDHGLSLRPWCPKDWSGYAFHIHYRGRLIYIEVDKEIRVHLKDGEALEIRVNDQNQTLTTQLVLPL